MMGNFSMIGVIIICYLILMWVHSEKLATDLHLSSILSLLETLKSAERVGIRKA